jgi:hypothetical protein
MSLNAEGEGNNNEQMILNDNIAKLCSNLSIHDHPSTEMLPSFFQSHNNNDSIPLEDLENTQKRPASDPLPSSLLNCYEPGKRPGTIKAYNFTNRSVESRKSSMTESRKSSITESRKSSITDSICSYDSVNSHVSIVIFFVS